MDCKLSDTFREDEHLPLYSDAEYRSRDQENLDQPWTSVPTGTLDAHKAWKRYAKRLSSWATLLNIILIVINTVVASRLFLHGRYDCLQKTYSPAQAALSYTSQISGNLYNDTTSPWLKKLDDGSKELWDEVARNMMIRISADERRSLDRESVMLSDDSGDYLASLDVYHQFHCLECSIRSSIDITNIEQWYLRLYIEKGPPETLRITPEDHAYHCIEHLRQVIQCHGDVSVITYEWRANDPMPMPRWEMERTCVDWEALNNWAGKRRIVNWRDSVLINP